MKTPEAMELRDALAGKVLEALLANPASVTWGGNTVTQPIEYARVSYAFADAMLKARSEGEAAS